RPERVTRVQAAGAPGGDRARQELLDRPVDDRDGHEQDRPQQRDALVLGVAEDVRGDREVREGEQPGGCDADGEDPRAGGEAGGAAHARASSTVHGSGERTSSTVAWRATSSTKP